jgi:ribosome biogenesis GTPase
LIIGGSRGLYDVQTPDGQLRCTLRGRLRKQLEYPEGQGTRHRVRGVSVFEHDPVAVGDRVRVRPLGGETGVIEGVLARAGAAFTRGDPGRAPVGLTTVAGLDQLVAVFAVRDPAPHLRLLDRFLVVAEAQDIRAVICMNKVDLGIPHGLEERLAVYQQLGYPLVRASTATGEGIAALCGLLAGRVSALLGPSGVGKSSLLNALQPDLAQRVGAVGTTTHKGRHTTTGTRLFPLEAGGHLADTAGIRALALQGALVGQLDRCFLEFRPYLGTCHHTDCAHLQEPGCAIRAAVRAGALDRERYESYCRMRVAGADSDWAEAE